MGVDSGIQREKRPANRLLLAVLTLLLSSLLAGCGGYVASAEAPEGAMAAKDASSADYGEVAADEAYVGNEPGSEPRTAYFGAIGPDAAPEPEPTSGMAKSLPSAEEPVTPDVASPGGDPEPTKNEPGQRTRRPLLIYKAELALDVFHAQTNLDKIEQMALGSGGYLVGREWNRIIVRVPAAKFEETIAVILKLGEVHRRSITAEDVTAEFTDLQIRLKNATAMRDRLEALLQDAKNVEEALMVEEQLGRVAEKIEIMKGRLKLLRELTAFSTITVEFSERQADIKSRVELPFGWLNDLGLGSLLNL